jgi:translocation and assembly module TamB
MKFDRNRLHNINFKAIGQIAVVAGFFFMLGFALKYHYPQLKTWAIFQIREVSAKNFGIEVKPKNIELSLFPLGIQLSGLEVQARKEHKKDFPNVSAKYVAAYVDILGLLTGRLRLSTVDIVEPQIMFIQKSKARSGAPMPVQFSFRALRSIPINRLRVLRMNLEARLAEPEIFISTKNFSAAVDNYEGALDFDIEGPEISYRQLDNKIGVDFSFATKGHVYRTEINFTKLQLRRGDSHVSVRGTAFGKVEEGILHEMEFDSKVHLNLPEIHDLTTKIFPNVKQPAVNGIAEVAAISKYSTNKGFSVQFLTKTQDLKIDRFTVGNLESRGDYRDKNVDLNHFIIRNQAGEFGLRNAHLNLGDKVTVKSELTITALELQKFLETLGLHEVPTVINLSGLLNCEGEIVPDLGLTCQGGADGKNLHVYTGREKRFSIVKLPAFSAQGQVKVNKQSVTYQADLKVKEFTGKSNGVIEFAKGFKIYYETPALAFGVMDHFVNLKTEGIAKLSGTTEGDAHSAVINTKAQVTDFWLDNYLLDSAEFNFSYGKGHLYFNDINGHVDSTSYNGQVEIDLGTHEIKLNARSSDTDLKDVQRILSRKFQLPFEASGFGKMQISLAGPLDPSKFDFKFLSHFSDGKIASESYDSLIANVSAEKGLIKSNKIIMTKNASQISVTGQITPQHVIQVTATGDQLRIEDSQFIKSRLSELRGQLDFDLSLKGPVTKPQTLFKGYLSQMSLGSESMESSTFTLEFGEQAITGNGKFFGNRVASTFALPFAPDSPFHINLNAKGFNFMPLMGLFLKNERHWDYKSSLTGTMDIKSNRGGFWKSTGFANIEAIAVERGPVFLASDAPTKISFDNGLMNSTVLNLKGPNSYLRAQVTNSTKENLNLTASAKADLSLFALFTPFLKEMRGLMTVSLKVRDSVDNPNILGSALVEGGLVKLPDFPTAFQNLRADVLFNNQKILINSASANLGGGNLTAGGGITIIPKKSPIIDVQGSFEQVHLAIPDGVKSVGTGTIAITGNGLPYKLSVKANVESGDVVKEFSSDDSQPGTVKQSALLPKKATDREVSPITLDLNLLLSENIKIKNENFDTFISGQIQVLGEPRDLKINGQINFIKGGKIFFRKTPFEVSTGMIRFKEVMNNPELFITSTARVKDYDITLTLSGMAQKMNFQLTSQPTLTQPEIICLLALGVTCDTMEKNVASSQQGQASTYQIGAAILSNNPLQKQIKDRYGVDFGIGSTFDSDNASVPQVTVGKQITPKIGAKVIHTRGKEPKVDAQIFWDLNRNWSFVGSWEGKTEDNPTEKATEKTNNNSVGVDLEYKMEFK